MSAVAGQGKRAGSRRGAKRPPRFQPRLLLLAAAVTLSVVAWGYLVFAAIDFGASARSGDSTAWWLLVVASAGAVACLFLGLMLVARLLRELGITGSSSTLPPPPPPPPSASSTPSAGPSSDHAGRRRSSR